MTPLDLIVKLADWTHRIAVASADLVAVLILIGLTWAAFVVLGA